MASDLTIDEINRRNADYWNHIRTLTEDPVLLGLSVEREAQKRNAFLNTKRLFETLLDAKFLKDRLAQKFAQRGGNAPKRDPLNTLIREWVRRKPDISIPEIERRLRDHAGIPPIEDVDENTVYFIAANGLTKHTPLSGLKDRLSRIKSKFKSKSR